MFCLHTASHREEIVSFVFLCEVKATAETKANRNSRKLCHHPSCRRLLFIPLIVLACDTTTPWALTPDKQSAQVQILPMILPSCLAVLSSTSSADSPAWHTQRTRAHLTGCICSSQQPCACKHTLQRPRVSGCCRAARLGPAGRGGSGGLQQGSGCHDS